MLHGVVLPSLIHAILPQLEIIHKSTVIQGIVLLTRNNLSEPMILKVCVIVYSWQYDMISPDCKIISYLFQNLKMLAMATSDQDMYFAKKKKFRYRECMKTHSKYGSTSVFTKHH